MRVTLGRSFNLAKRWGLSGSDRSPVTGVPRPRGITSRQRFLTADEATRLRKAVEASSNPMLAPFVSLLLYTGCRFSELTNATWEHVDLERGATEVTVRPNPSSSNTQVRSFPRILALLYRRNYQCKRVVALEPKANTCLNGARCPWRIEGRALGAIICGSKGLCYEPALTIKTCGA